MIVWCDEKKLRTLGMREGDNTWYGKEDTYRRP